MTNHDDFAWIDDEYVYSEGERIGRKIQGYHAGSRSPAAQRLYDDKFKEVIIGACGEVWFGLFRSLIVDEKRRKHGDKGIDFFTDIGTIDVKTSRFTRNLIKFHDVDRLADMIVWLHFNEEIRKVTPRGFILQDKFIDLMEFKIAYRVGHPFHHVFEVAEKVNNKNTLTDIRSFPRVFQIFPDEWDQQ